MLLEMFQAPASWELLLGFLILFGVVSNDDKIASFEAFDFFFL